MAGATTMTCTEALRSALRVHFDSGVNEAALNDVFVDFENAQPTDIEREVYDLIVALLTQANDILADVSQYGDGASEAIRLAIRNPTDEQQQLKTWNVLLSYVHRLKSYYEFSLRLEQAFPHLLWELCSGPLPPVEQLQCQQALSKQFAHILDFTLRFDEVKMCTPAVQNDFSYYRRTMSRRSMAYGIVALNEEAIVPVDMANTISFFYADPTPMLATLRRATEAFVKQHSTLPIENTTDTLATMANVCRSMVQMPTLCSRFREPSTIPFCLRVMTGTIILYDHVHPLGAFVRNSAVDMRAAIRTLHQQYDKALAIEKRCSSISSQHTDITVKPPSPLTCDSSQRIQSLLNALRYTTKHANDANTPKSLRVLLGLQT